jgi:hypothetical protein
LPSAGPEFAGMARSLAMPDACHRDAAQDAGDRSEGLTFWFILKRFEGSYRRLICANRPKFAPYAVSTRSLSSPGMKMT